MSEPSLLVGFDLCDDFSQISCYNPKVFEPESICFSEDNSKYLIPTVLAVREDTKEWLSGEEAVICKQKEGFFLVEHIIEKILIGETVVIYGVEFTGVTLLERFFRRTLSFLKRYYPDEVICKLVVTIEEANTLLVDTIYEALTKLGINKDRVLVQSHAQSYLYYALSQKKELWVNDVGLFDFDERGLTYHQICINRKLTPMIVQIYSEDFTKELSYQLFCEQQDKEKIAYIFDNIAKEILYKQIVPTLYMTGKGFEGDWANGVFQSLCTGRRVFKGMNLYTKGACYKAKEIVEKEKFEEFLFLSQEMLQSDIMIRVYQKEEFEDIVLVEAATAWYEIDKSIDIILDRGDEIEIIVWNILEKKSEQYKIKLEELPKRPARMTRLRVKVQFVDRYSCAIMIKDQGFGEFYPSTNRIWEKVLTIS